MNISVKTLNAMLGAQPHAFKDMAKALYNPKIALRKAKKELMPIHDESAIMKALQRQLSPERKV